MPWRADVEVRGRRARLGFAVFAGLDAVYYLVHAIGQARDFERADRTGAYNTRVAAEEAGVGRLVDEALAVPSLMGRTLPTSWD